MFQEGLDRRILPSVHSRFSMGGFATPWNIRMGRACRGMPRQARAAPAQAEFPDVRLQYPPKKRGIDTSYETVRRWSLKFGCAYAARIRPRRPRPSDRWHLDEVFIRIGGKIHYLWRAVDDEGEVLDVIVQVVSLLVV
jgi:hypothetical protein